MKRWVLTLLLMANAAQGAPIGPDRLPFQVCDLIDACEEFLPGQQNWVLPPARERLTWDGTDWEAEDFASSVRVRGEFDDNDAVILDHALATSQGFYPGIGIGSGSELPTAAVFRVMPGVLASDSSWWLIGGRLELGLHGDVIAGDSIRSGGNAGVAVLRDGVQMVAMVEQGEIGRAHV